MQLRPHSVPRSLPRVFGLRNEPRTTTEDIRQLILDANRSFEEFINVQDARFGSIEGTIDDLSTRLGRLTAGGGTLPGGGADRRKLNDALRAYLNGDKQTFMNSMSVGTDPEGGYTVIPVFSPTIRERLFETSPMRTVARIEQITMGDAFEEPWSTDEADAVWVGERQARPETTAPTLDKLRVPVHEQYAAPEVTQQYLDDSVSDVGGFIERKVTNKFGRKENAAFVNGDGVLKPRGFLSYGADATTEDDDARAWGVLQYTPSGASGAFAATDPGDALIDLQATLKADYRASAVWMMNRKTAAATRKLKDGQSNYLWQQSIIVGQPDLLLGSPVVLAEDMPDIGANSFSIAYGAFDPGYLIVDRLGNRILRDPYTNKPNVIFYVYRRVGGDVADTDAIKLMKFAAS